MSFQINHESWHAGKSRLWLCTKFIEIINAQLDDGGNGVKVIELTAYHDWKRRAFSEASKNSSWPQTAKTRYDSTKYTASYNSHHSALEEMLNCCCCCAVIVKQPTAKSSIYLLPDRKESLCPDFTLKPPQRVGEGIFTIFLLSKIKSKKQRFKDRSTMQSVFNRRYTVICTVWNVYHKQHIKHLPYMVRKLLPIFLIPMYGRTQKQNKGHSTVP